ncbi:MAG: HAD family phosphatase [Verrucomicrobia bacterium]|nr:HAD family phosphatase [Verrucomicrobiota bacterium]
MPEHIMVFDLGKVLLDFDYAIALRRIAERDGLDPAPLQAILGYTPLLLAYEEGQVSTTEFHRAFSERTGYQRTLNQFRADFADIFSPIAPMIELQRRCQEAGHATYIFSNTNELAVEFIRAHYAFFQNFTGHILSYECRALKPAPGMYETLEKLTGHTGGRFVYLDDRPENIEAAWQRGWHALIHQDPPASIEFIQQFLGK